MKYIKSILSGVLLAGLAVSGTAFAHGHFYGGFRGGIYLQPWPLFYPAPYYYGYSAPQVVVVPQSSTTYVEQGDAPPPAQSNYWYYCSNPDGFYPYVKQCPAGWQKVQPQSPPPPR